MNNFINWKLWYFNTAALKVINKDNAKKTKANSGSCKWTNYLWSRSNTNKEKVIIPDLYAMQVELQCHILNGLKFISYRFGRLHKKEKKIRF